MKDPTIVALIGIPEMIIVLLVAVVMVVVVVAVVLGVRAVCRRGASRPPVPGGPVPPEVGRSVYPGPIEATVAARGSSTAGGACPKCGAPLAPGHAQGLCPRCLLVVGLGTQPSAGGAEGARPESAADPAELARLFPQLEVLEPLGQGGMGVVYKVRQRHLDRLAALKLLPREAARDPAFAERFNREARALARLNHPNIITVYDFGEVGGLFYLVMEYVDGADLRRVLQQGRLGPAEALRIVPPICDALQYAHANGVVHRDIKPGNILLDRDGRVKIADFGIAKLADAGAGGITLTQSKQSMGTPHYMAPEQVENPQAVDHRADIYSVGVVFYEMLTGELPLGRFAPPSRRVEVDVRLDEVVLRALEKEPARRYQQVGEVRTELDRITGHGDGAGAARVGQGNRAVGGMAPGSQGALLIPAMVWAALFPLWFLIPPRPISGMGGLHPLMVLPIILLGAAPFGTTLLGLLAVRQARQLQREAGGRLERALYVAGLFPALTVLAAVFGCGEAVLSHQPGGRWFSLGAALVVGVVMVRWALPRVLRKLESKDSGGVPWRRVLPWGVLVVQFGVVALLVGIFMARSSASRASSAPPAVWVGPEGRAFMEGDPGGSERPWRMEGGGADGGMPVLLSGGLLSASGGRLEVGQLEGIQEALQQAWQEYREALRGHLDRSTNDSGHVVIRVRAMPGVLESVEGRFWTAVDALVDREFQGRLRDAFRNSLRPPTRTGSSVVEGVLKQVETEQALLRFGDEPFELEYWRVGSWYHFRGQEERSGAPELAKLPVRQGPELPGDLRLLVDLSEPAR